MFDMTSGVGSVQKVPVWNFDAEMEGQDGFCSDGLGISPRSGRLFSGSDGSATNLWSMEEEANRSVSMDQRSRSSSSSFGAYSMWNGKPSTYRTVASSHEEPYNFFADVSSSNESGMRMVGTEANGPRTLSSRDNSEPSKRLHVSNIPFKFNDQNLRCLFQPFGEVTEAEVIYNERGSKGFGFVTMARASEANLAKHQLHGHIVLGRQIEVNDATPRPCSVKSFCRARSISLSNELGCPSDHFVNAAVSRSFGSPGLRGGFSARTWSPVTNDAPDARRIMQLLRSASDPADLTDAVNRLPENPYKKYAVELQEDEWLDRRQKWTEVGMPDYSTLFRPRSQNISMVPTYGSRTSRNASDMQNPFSESPSSSSTNPFSVWNPAFAPGY